jgi:Kef-type K+ transport system membrane component KefB
VEILSSVLSEAAEPVAELFIVELFLALAILILASEFFGTVARMLGQPRVFGSLMAGVIIGPNLLNFMGLPFFPEASHHFVEQNIKVLAELGVMFLMFNVGLDVHLKELIQVGKAAIFGGTAGALVPVAVGAAFLLAYDYSMEISIFAGVALAATSVSISAQTLVELKVLKSKEGTTVLASAIVDDILAILLLSIVTATIVGQGASSESQSVPLIAFKMFAYLGVATAFAWFVLPVIFAFIGKYYQYLIAPSAVAWALLFAWSAEEFGGVAAITGAFIAGMGMSQIKSSRIKRSIKAPSNGITYAFLAPVFFVSIGLEIDLSNFPMEAVVFSVILLALAVLTKVIGCGLGVKLAGGLTNVESLRIGVCMVSRGEVGLIIMNVGFQRAVFVDTGYLSASLLLVILATTVLTPPLVRWSFGLADKQKMQVQET